MLAVDRLDATMAATGSIACVGLDPRPALVPPDIADRHRATADPRQAVAAAFVETNLRILDAIAGHCAAVKPQAACYEAYGLAGWQALLATIAAAAERDIPVVLDAKRADIGSTTEHYGQMAFGGAPDLDGNPVGGTEADWITLNPYLGADGIDLVLRDGAVARTQAAFVLVKTSNPSSGELQDRALRNADVPGTNTSGNAHPDATVADAVADLVHAWGSSRVGTCGLHNLGAVVGATYPEHAQALRDRMPHTMFLVPGYGAQGGGGATALAGQRPDGRGMLVSSSRGITGAWRDRPDVTLEVAVADALAAMNADLDTHRA